MAELFDLYDEHDSPLGETKLRSDVHRDGDWHRTVHIYVINLQGEVLVQLRSPHKDQKPNLWQTHFGGHVAAGKDYDETAVRELEEEIGLCVDLEDLHLLEKHSHSYENNSEHSKIYYYLFMGDDSEIHFNDGEVSEVKWMTPEKIKSAMITERERWTGSPERFEEIMQAFKNI